MDERWGRPRNLYMTEHPLPNLNMCLRWIRHFNTHAFELKSIASCYDEMKAVCIGDEAIGCFIYRHDSVYWLLLGVWEMWFKFSSSIEKELNSLQDNFEREVKMLYEDFKRKKGTMDSMLDIGKSSLGY